jgi:hypothetical protein
MTWSMLMTLHQCWDLPIRRPSISTSVGIRTCRVLSWTAAGEGHACGCVARCLRGSEAGIELGPRGECGA